MNCFGWILAAAAVGGFPGPETRLPSPNGSKAVVWQAPRAGDPEYTHHLLLDDGKGKLHPLMPFHRNVSVEWSPSGMHVAVTCHCGSDFSDVVVFDIANPRHGISVTKALQRRVGRIRVLNNHHAYVEAIRWLNDESLEVLVWGYGEQNPKGFNWTYDFGLGGTAELVKARDGLPSEQ
jgi:hypothetical protein